MTELGEKELLKIEEQLVDFYNNALPYFDNVPPDTNIPMPIASTDTGKDLMRINIFDRRLEAFELVDEIGVEAFFKILENREEAVKLMINYNTPMNCNIIQLSTGEYICGQIEVNIGSPEFDQYMQDGTGLELPFLHEMAHDKYYRLLNEGITIKPGYDETVDNLIAKLLKERGGIAGQQEQHEKPTFIAILYYLARNIVQDTGYFEKVKGNRKVEGDPAEWLVMKMYTRQIDQLPEDYYMNTVYQIGTLIRERDYSSQ
jgi:hypothetical protein